MDFGKPKELPPGVADDDPCEWEPPSFGLEEIVF